jgi:hypothetical protein
MFSNVKNPRWNDFHKNSIFCEVETKQGKHNYVAAKDDSTTHGKSLYAELIAGKYGAIEDYKINTQIYKVDKNYKALMENLISKLVNSIYTNTEKVSFALLENSKDEDLRDVAQAYDMNVERFKEMLNTYKNAIVQSNIKLLTATKALETITEDKIPEIIADFNKFVTNTVDEINKFRKQALPQIEIKI